MHPHSPIREHSHNSECSLDISINLHISSVLHFWIDTLESMSLSQNFTVPKHVTAQLHMYTAKVQL